MSNHTISDKAVYFLLEHWYNQPDEERCRFRAFCCQAGVFGDDFKFVNNVKRVADCHENPMRYVQLQLSLVEAHDSAPEADEDAATSDAEANDAEEADEADADDATSDVDEEKVDSELDKRIELVLNRQLCANRLLWSLLFIIGSPIILYNGLILYLYYHWYNTHTVYLLGTPDVIYL